MRTYNFSVQLSILRYKQHFKHSKIIETNSRLKVSHVFFNIVKRSSSKSTLIKVIFYVCYIYICPIFVNFDPPNMV